MNLLFDYPWYCLLFCFLAGAVYSGVLYWRGGRKDTALPRVVGILLPLLRFLAVTLISFLLLAPLLRRNVGVRERPIVVLVQDKSTSVPSQSRALLDACSQTLSANYQVVLDSFGAGATDIAAALTSVGDRYAGRNLGAVVLATDGIYNQGQNPAIVAPRLAVPVYTVALGDTTQRRDAAITHVRCNRTAFLGNTFPVEVTVRAHLLAGQRATLSVSRGGRTLGSQEILYTDNHYTATHTLVIEADKPGLQHYTVSLTLCAGEGSSSNNSRTLAVEVRDGHQRITILAAAPHPDIAALKRSIEANPNYEVDVQLLSDNPRLEHVKESSLLVLHNLPAQGSQLDLGAFRGIPTLYVVGVQTDLGRFNALHTGLEIVARARKSDEVMAERESSFALFTLADDVGGRLEQLPPLVAPFGTYRSVGNMQVLFSAKVGGMASGRPLIAFCQQEGVRRAFVVGEGLWRWRLQDYQMTGSTADVDLLVEKMVVYTSQLTNHDQLQVTHEPIYQENEPVTIQAMLYNDNFEPVNDPAVSLALTRVDSADKAVATYEMNRSGTGYSLHLGLLAPGHYGYTATTTLAGKSHKAVGSFIVEELNLEELSLVADHALLATIATTTGGEMIYPHEVDRLPKLLAARDDLKTVVYPHTRYTDLLNLPWLLVLLVLLLSVEWAVRKFFFG